MFCTIIYTVMELSILKPEFCRRRSQLMPPVKANTYCVENTPVIIFTKGANKSEAEIYI